METAKNKVWQYIKDEYTFDEHSYGSIIAWLVAYHLKMDEESVQQAIYKLQNEGKIEEMRFTKELVLSKEEKRKLRLPHQLEVSDEPYLNKKKVWSLRLKREKTIWGYEVDKGIAHGIAMVNNLGYPTWACCSGLKEDHSKIGKGHGYIAFLVSGDNMHPYYYENLKTASEKAGLDFEDEELKKRVKEGNVFHLTTVCVRHNEKDEEEEVKRKWNLFFETIKEIS